jgi:glycosyltransferase involved in cell wall biosynthesis
LNPKVIIDYVGVKRDKGIRNPFNRVSAVFKTRKFFKIHNDYDVVLGIGTYPNILLSFVPGSRKFAIIGCEHGSFRAVPLLWQFIRHFRYPEMDVLVSLTNQDLPHLLKLNTHSIVIPNSTPLMPLKPASLVNNRILAVGRLSYEKGYDYLVAIFSRFARIKPDWHLRIIGDGPLQNKLEHWIEEKNLAGKIQLAGTTDQILEEYMNASIFILTSRNEGLPMVLIEAQRCGLPLVAFDIETGPSDIIEQNKNGYLIESFNIDKMVQALIALANNPEKRKEFGLHGFKESQKFSERSVYEKWEGLFMELKNKQKLSS